MSRLMRGFRQLVELVPAPALQRLRAMFQREAPGCRRHLRRRSGRKHREALFEILAGRQPPGDFVRRLPPKNPRVTMMLSSHVPRRSLVVERLRRKPAADQETVSDETERRGIDERASVADELGEAGVDVFVLGRLPLDIEPAVDVEPPAAVGQLERLAVAGLDRDLPGLLAGLSPIELGGQAVERAARTEFDRGRDRRVAILGECQARPCARRPARGGSR